MNTHTTRQTGSRNKSPSLFASLFAIFFLLTLCIVLAAPAHALVSVSTMGYHPQANKTVTVYTSATSGTFQVVRSDGSIIKTGTLHTVVFNNVVTNCQGNNPCLVGDFSDVVFPGTYHIESAFGNSSSFSISANIYGANIPVFGEFYDALLMQGSSYHADMMRTTDPLLFAMADGSFIMTADQAALPAIRLGSAYRRNPTLLSFDNHNIVRANTPDIIEQLMLYTSYLESLQDAKIQQRTDGVGFRLSTGTYIDGAFVPAATNLTSLNIYDPGHSFIQPVAVTSLCGNLSGASYSACMDTAAQVYKCQADEPCLSISYNDITGTRVAGQTDGYAVDRGWTYEFGCFFDVDLTQGNFNDKPNPCMVYDTTESRYSTAVALLAYVEAAPGIYQYDRAKAAELVDRAIRTQAYIKSSYPDFVVGDNDTGFYGAANFILYDLTQNPAYLQEAYRVRNVVSTQLVSDSTRDNEFYWEEYIKHRAALTNGSFTYTLAGGADPAQIFVGKMYFDYSGNGQYLSIAANGEHVYQFDPNIQFQNSRYMLTEGVFASKTMDVSQNNESFINSIADAQLSWLTGNNGVDLDAGFTNNISSVSFIFGIGNFPTQFHSRLLMNTGYSALTNGAVVGMRGTGLMFQNASGEFVYLDGRTTILGIVLGAQGNGYRNETKTPEFNPNQVFANGLSYIPGWINGAFDLNTDTDTIFNYKDDRNTYEFTESTNEIVATAVELFAYRDARYNHVTPLPTPVITQGSATLSVASTPGGSFLYIDGSLRGGIPLSGYLVLNETSGDHSLLVQLSGYANATRNISLLPGDSQQYTFTLTALNVTNGTNQTNTTNQTFAVLFTTSPTGANLTLDGMYRGVTPLSINVTPGNHTIVLAKDGYITLNDVFNTTQSGTLNYLLTATNATTSLINQFSNASVENGTLTAFEATTLGFTVQYSSSTTIRWYVDGSLVKTTQTDRDTLTWMPDILYVDMGPDPMGKIRVANILVSGNNQVNTTFNVTVKNYINPYWQNTVFGATDDILHVITNNNARIFTNVIAQLQTDNGALTNETLSYQYADNETDWKVHLTNMAEGNTYVRVIYVFDNTTNFSQALPVIYDRAHYRQVTSGGGAGDGGGGGGGGGAVYKKEKTLTYADLHPEANVSGTDPTFIVATFNKDVIKDGESVELAVDATDNGEVASVIATIKDDTGKSVDVSLSLIRGTKGYGTWNAVLSGYASGRHELTNVRITNAWNHTINVAITDRAFYVIGKTVTSGEKLVLVYALIDKNVINSGDNITVRLDARDFSGVTSATALLRSKDSEIKVPLTRISGEPSYGTWEGTIVVSTPDTTYTLVSVTLGNANEQREIRVYGQKVYVNYETGNAVTGMVIGTDPVLPSTVADFIRRPTTPLLIGIAGMVLAMIIVGSMQLVKIDE